MRYSTLPNGEKERKAIDVEPLGPGRYAVTLDGVRHEVDALTVEPGSVSLLLDGKSYNVELEDRNDDVFVTVRGQVEQVDVANERQLRLRASRAIFSAEGKQVITAPMPGKVVKVLVKAGDEVTEGQGLVVVEAMKMENELKSPKAGKVVELWVAEGAAVENNAKLLSVE